MILSRVIEHVKKQHWTAVFLDFVIVVAGVFVATQVSNWNEARRLKIEERATLVRLQAETERDVEYWRQEVFIAEKATANQRLLLQVLNAGAISSEQRELVEDALLRIGQYGSMDPQRSVYEELIASGGLQLISDLDARNAVSAYAAQVAYVQGQLTYFRADFPVVLRAFEGRVLSVYAPDTPSLRRFEYDIAALSKDRQFVSDMIDLVRDQLQFETYREQALKAAIKMCDAVSHAVSMACKPHEIDMSEVREREGVNQ